MPLILEHGVPSSDSLGPCFLDSHLNNNNSMLSSSMTNSSVAEQLVPEKLRKLSMTDHIARIQVSINGIIGMLNQDRENMKAVKEYISQKGDAARSEALELMRTLKQETDRLQNMFSVSITNEKKQLQDLKSQVQKISGEHLKTEQLSFHLQTKVTHCQNQIGYKQLLRKH